ncbi:hypothetical protein [Streptomyces sp. WL006]|uniref:hypothetical protein n=1 Tax=Streptomyces sp. WL006 TaxID=3423915 RepID=UPI003F6C9ADF
MCLADGTPVAVLTVTVCGECGADAVAPEVAGWLNLLTGQFTAGSPPVGTRACAGQPQQFEVGQWCDLDAEGAPIAPVLVEYEYDDDGRLVGVRMLTPGGDPYTVTGTLGICPGPVSDVEYLVLCDVQQDGTVVEFLRALASNGDDTSTARDTTLDGSAPYTPTGAVGVCQPTESRHCETTTLCDVPLNATLEPIFMAANQGGSRSGTLPSGVGWTVNGGTGSVPNWWTVAFFPSPTIGPLPVSFTRPVSVEWSARVGRITNGVGVIVMPPGTELVSLAPVHVWDAVTRTLSPAASAGQVSATSPVSRFRHRGPVTALTFASDGATGAFHASQRAVGDFLVTPVTVPLLRTVCRDSDGAVISRTDTTLAGAPYTVVGTVGVCQSPEPCPSTVETLRLCDLNPIVDPDPETGLRCAVPFLRHLVHDCTGALAETRDTELDGITPYAPVQITDCGSAVPALAELLWPQTGIAENPAGVSGQDFIYTVTNPQTDEVAEVRLHASSTAGGACGAYDPAAPVFNNPTTYTLTLDAAAQEMSTFRLDLLDFDTFEGVTNLNPVPSRVEGDVTWTGSTITANQSNITARLYYDRPPATLSYRYGNTGGGTACSAVAFQGMTLIPDGCCGCDTSLPDAGLDVETALLCLLDSDGDALRTVRVDRLYDNQSGDLVQERLLDPTTGDVVTPPAGATLGLCPGAAGPGTAPTSDVELLPMCVVNTAGGGLVQRILAELIYDAETGDRAAVRYVDPLTWGPVALPGGTRIALCPPDEEEPGPDAEVLALCDTAGNTTTPFLRHLIYTAGSPLPTVVDTGLDGVTPYTPAGTVGLCPAADPCPAQVIEKCRCDDADGDGTGEVDYVELLRVDCDGVVTSLGTYLADLSGPYTTVSPVPCPTDGAPAGTAVQARRIDVAPGASWSAAGTPLLQAVTATAYDGPAEITTADGTSILREGESASWAVARDGDATLAGPLTIRALSGTVAVAFTTAVAL